MICKNKRCHKEIDSDSIYCKYCGRKQTTDSKKALRNPNGYGSVIYLGDRRRKPWAVRVSTWENEEQTFRYISYHETKTEALKALAQEQICPSSPKANITFKELFEEWKDTPAFKDIGNKTQSNYEIAYRYFEPLYKMKFTEIRTSHMQKIIDELKSAPNKEGKTRPLSGSSKSKAKILCGLLYKYAMQNDICNKNYAEFIKVVKGDKKEKEIFSDEEIKILQDNDNIPYVDTILILIYTGLRINELLTLSKHGVDLEAMTITGGLKTDAGRDRTVPIHPKILPYIKKWYDKATDRLIFKGENEPVYDNFYRKDIYYPILELLAISKKTPHSTRHTCATLLARFGADTNSIKLILGHTDYAFTADTYTHTDAGQLGEAIKLIQ